MSGDESKGFRSWTNDDLVKRAQEKWGFPQEVAVKMEGCLGVDLDQNEDKLERWFKLVLKDDTATVTRYWGRIRNDLRKQPGHPLNPSTTQGGSGGSHGEGKQALAAVQNALTGLTLAVTDQSEALTLQNQQFEALKADLQRGGHMGVGSPVTLPADAARRLLDDRKRLKMEPIIDAKATEGARSVLTTEEAAELKHSVSEFRVTASLFPHISDMFKSELKTLVVVNGEDYRILPKCDGVLRGEKTEGKPDMWIMHCLFLDPKTKVNAPDWRAAQSFGTPARSLVPFAGLLEGKMSVFTESSLLSGIGESVDYIIRKQHLSKKDMVPIPRCILYGADGFILIEYRGAAPSDFVRWKWDTPGSHDAFLNFMMPSLSVSLLIDKLCAKLGAEASTAPCFLGAGANGYAFKVVRKDSKCALKVTLTLENDEKAPPDHDLRKELEGLRRAGPDIAMKPLHDVAHVSDASGCLRLSGYLLTLGVPVSHNSLKDPTPLLRRLHSLHAKGFTHGDPRVPNFVVLAEGKHVNPYRLIDFRTIDLTAPDYVWDMGILVESILGRNLCEAVSVKLNGYDPKVEDSVKALCIAVSEAHSAKA